MVAAGGNSDVETVDGTDDPQAETVLAEREWRIQCKRYKTINPKLMRRIVAETVPDPEYPPHGLIGTFEPHIQVEYT